MVLWCKNCGALVGLKVPFTNWKIDRDATCRWCEMAVQSPPGSADSTESMRSMPDDSETSMPLTSNNRMS